MKVLVTGGSGVVGASTVTALLQRGHSVRLLSRHADRDARSWAHGVAPVQGDISDPASVRGAADGCDAIIHLVAIVAEDPPETTFEKVNVEGTRVMVKEAERAGVKRLVYVSSLGCDRGESGYHRSKHAGERVVEQFNGRYIILRPGAVYGPGDEHLSVLLRLVRTLPVVPVIGDGEQQFQPAWHEDIAEAIAMSVERDDLFGRTLELAGVETTSQRQLMALMREVTGRSPAIAPVPELFASLGIRIAEMAGVDIGFNESQFRMLVEGNVIRGDAVNALTQIFHVDPTPLRAGIARLADVQPEQLPQDGVGPMRRKRFWADITGSAMTPDALFAAIREQFMTTWPDPVTAAVEPDGATAIELGETLTLDLAVRGHCQVRVAELSERERHFTLVTVDGHPLAGMVRFSVAPASAASRFCVEIFERPATIIDYVAMTALGDAIQASTWVGLVERVVALSGGSTTEIHQEKGELDEHHTTRVERWAEDLVLARRRAEAGV